MCVCGVCVCVYVVCVCGVCMFAVCVYVVCVCVSLFVGSDKFFHGTHEVRIILRHVMIMVTTTTTTIIIIIIRNNLEAVPGKHSIDSLQHTAILGTSHIIRKVLQCEA